MLRFSIRNLAGVLLLLSTVLGQAIKPAPRASTDAGSSSDLANHIYRIPFFGFSYKVPFGWVERTADMGEESTGDKPADPSGARVLLAVFERPPEATGETVNSAVVIAAEPVKSYPGLKTAVDYFAPLEEITKAKGFSVVNEPYEFLIGSKKLAREDFSKPLGTLTMWQATLVTVQKGFIVSFTFIAGGADQIDELIEGLAFSSVPTSHHSSRPLLTQ
jgi:hypothetical protein